MMTYLRTLGGNKAALTLGANIGLWNSLLNTWASPKGDKSLVVWTHWLVASDGVLTRKLSREPADVCTGPA